MKVLLIYHNINTKNIRHLPLGLSLLSGILKKHGHDVNLLYIQDEISDSDLLGYIGGYDPGVIGVSTGTLQWPDTVRLARKIKAVFKVPLVCGGPHPTFMPEEVISEPSIDMLCIGEGEYAMLDIVQRLETGGDMAAIPNVWVKNEAGMVFRNEVRALVENLDDLPFPDRSILPYQDIINESKTEPVIITSRGCPYNCTFCSNSAIKKIYKGKGRYVRQRTPQNVIDEIGFLKSHYTFDTLNFYDEAFGFNREWNRNFCALYEKEFSMPFGAFIRAETVDRESFRIMKRAGLALIYLGVESGNEEIRRKVMNRKVSNETIINTCRDAQAEGIQVWTFNIVGVPGETVDTIRETMELNRIINPHFASVSIYQPFPGTDMYDECVRNNYIEKDYRTNLYEDSVLNLKTIKHHELLEGFYQFQELANQMKEAHEKRGDRIFLVDL